MAHARGGAALANRRRNELDVRVRREGSEESESDLKQMRRRRSVPTRSTFTFWSAQRKSRKDRKNHFAEFSFTTQRIYACRPDAAPTCRDCGAGWVRRGATRGGGGARHHAGRRLRAGGAPATTRGGRCSGITFIITARRLLEGGLVDGHHVHGEGEPKQGAVGGVGGWVRGGEE